MSVRRREGGPYTYNNVKSFDTLRSLSAERRPHCTITRTNSSTFSSNLSPTLVLSSSGAKRVHPDKRRSPSGSTRETHVAMASARIFEIRMRSLGSVDCSLSRNSENTDVVRFPSMKSMTAWLNQSANVEVYILREHEPTGPVTAGCVMAHRASEFTPSLSIPARSRFPVLQQTASVVAGSSKVR